MLANSQTQDDFSIMLSGLPRRLEGGEHSHIALMVPYYFPNRTMLNGHEPQVEELPHFIDTLDYIFHTPGVTATKVRVLVGRY